MAKDITDQKSGTGDRTFLLGEEKLQNVEEDAFGHEAHVETLEDIVGKVDTPWHVALYGTWGSGKSTIVNLLYKRIRSSQASGKEYTDLDSEDVSSQNVFEDTLCVSINAWKHAEDSVRTELLLDLNQSLQEELDRRFDTADNEDLHDNDRKQADPENQSEELFSDNNGVLDSERIINILYNVEQRTERTENSYWYALKNMDGFILGLIVALFFIFPLSVIQLPLPEPIGSIVRSLGAVLSLGIVGAIIKVGLDEFRETRKEIDHTLANPQSEWSGAYENLFNAIIDKTEQKYRDGQAADSPSDLDRIVITVDDLDRCRSQTAYHILIALKSFLAHEKCVYIIPCDEDALYKHLEAADQGEYLGDTVNQQNFLAKFFETELEIPTPSESRLGEYFEGRKNQFDRYFDPRSLQVLKDSELNTPRRITRALNRLVVLEELGINRGVIETGSNALDSAANADSIKNTTSTSPNQLGDPKRAFLAFISILQKDYPRFHAELERDPDLLTEVFEELSGGFSTEVRQGLDPLLDEIGVPEERRDPLLSFLNASQDVAQGIENPEAYIRLSGESPDPEEIFKARFDRNRVSSLQEFIRDVSENADDDEHGDNSDEGDAKLLAFVNYIERKLRDETAQVESIPTAIGIANTFERDHQRRIAEAVLAALQDERSGQILADVELETLEPIVSVLSQSQTREFLRLYVQSIIGETGLRVNNFASLIEGPGKPFEDEHLQKEFIDTIRSARQRGILSDESFGKVLSDIRNKKPELYTPELVRCK